MSQRDMKKLIAYSSIAHMGFVTLGAFIGYQIVQHTGRTSGIELGLDGSIVQMLSHGLVSGAMFLCVGVMYDRVHSREISAYGGVVNTMPMFAAFMVLFALANSRRPRYLGVRRRVLGHSGLVQGERLVCLPRGHDPDSGRRLHAVAGEARDLRRRRERSRARAQGSQSPRVPGAVAARGGRADRGNLARALCSMSCARRRSTCPSSC